MKWIVTAFALAMVSFGSSWIMSSIEPERTLATFTTQFEGRLNDQTANARLAAKKLDGTVVKPGEVLSFNQRVGSWSRDQGYKKAPVSFSGTLINAWGGGVCQTSTTLYNACLMAGLELIERHPHQFAPNYVPPGRDAAVAYDNVDLRFRNPYPFSVRVRAQSSQDQLEISIIGQGSAPPVTITQNKLGSFMPAHLSLGTGRAIKVRNPGKTGYEVQTFRIVGDRRELISQDSYPAMNRVVEHFGS